MQVTLTDEQETLATALTDLQRKTILNMSQGMSRVDAYWKAGGKSKEIQSARACVNRMLQNDSVKRFKAALATSETKAAIMTREEALERLSVLAHDDEDKRVSIQATKLLGELEGWEAPKKVDQRVMYTNIERRVIDDTDD